MDVSLLKHLGNMEQIAGIREAELLRGREKGVRVLEFHNAAGLRFTVVPDRCMDLYDLSWRGTNISFQSKNGLTAPEFCLPLSTEFGEYWPGGMLATCGLDNVGGYADGKIPSPTHGRIGAVPALTGGTETFWEGEEYILRATGEMHQTRLFGRHLSLKRTVETTLYGKSLKIRDVIANHTEREEPYMLLYHFNFGYPLVRKGTCTRVSPAASCSREATPEWRTIPAPVDGKQEELRRSSGFGREAAAVIWNEELELGAFVRWNTDALPNLTEWKRPKSHDYVYAFEPCNTLGLNRAKAEEAGKLAVLEPYGCIGTELELGVLEGMEEIRAFVRDL